MADNVYILNIESWKIQKGVLKLCQKWFVKSIRKSSSERKLTETIVIVQQILRTI